MKPVTTTVRVPKAARVLASAGLALCIVALLVDSRTMLVAGLSLGALLGVAAVVAYGLAPKRTVVLLDLRGKELHVTSRSDPLNDTGELYRWSTSVPVESLREIVSRRVYYNRQGTFLDVMLTRVDGATDTVFFPGDLREEVHAFFAQVQEHWPTLQFVDGGYHTRLPARKVWKSLFRRGGRVGRNTE